MARNTINIQMPSPADFVRTGFCGIVFKGKATPFFIKNIITETIASSQPHLFEKLNDFWAQKGVEFQTQVFDLYGSIREVLLDLSNEDKRIELLRDMINELIELHPVEELKAWLIVPGNQFWPTHDLNDQYDMSNSSNYSREQTYLLEDYKNLMAFTLQTRLLVPIWGEFLRNTEISSRFRLAHALNLTVDSLYGDGQGYCKLRQYVAATLKKNSDALDSGVLEMVSKEEYPEWIFSELVLRKLTSMPFSSPKPGDMGAYAVRHIGSHIMERVRKSENHFRTGKDKSKPDDTGSEDSQRSSYETCGVKASMPAGDIYYMQYYLSQVRDRAQELAPGISDELVSKFLNSMSVSQFVPSDQQMYLLRWVFAPIVSPRVFNDITKVVCNQCLAIAGAVMWSWGHKELAVFCTARVEDIALDNSVIQIGMDASRLTKSVQDEFERLYPYARLRRQATSKTYWMVLEAAKEMSESMRNVNWIPTLPEDLMQEVSHLVEGTVNNRNYLVPSNIKHLLYMLFVAISERQQPSDPVLVADQKAREMGLI